MAGMVDKLLNDSIRFFIPSFTKLKPLIYI